MPTTIERPPTAPVVAHATEYPPDRQRREQERNDSNSNESRAQRHGLNSGTSEEEPAVVVDAQHHEDHRLDGVAAYTAAAHHVLDPLQKHRDASKVHGAVERHAPSEIKHAYEEHGGAVETHRVNVAT
ncbi:hypothetical protein [Roseibium sp.]|uniref:hypothetical protein n=1 Tax=Roseibium sp. TaxID=1936156 RepID=UPI003A988042